MFSSFLSVPKFNFKIIRDTIEEFQPVKLLIHTTMMFPLTPLRKIFDNVFLQLVIVASCNWHQKESISNFFANIFYAFVCLIRLWIFIDLLAASKRAESQKMQKLI